MTTRPILGPRRSCIRRGRPTISSCSFPTKRHCPVQIRALRLTSPERAPFAVELAEHSARDYPSQAPGRWRTRAASAAPHGAACPFSQSAAACALLAAVKTARLSPFSTLNRTQCARVVAARLTGQDQRRGALRQALPSYRILSRSDRTGRGRAGAHRGAKSLTCRGADSSFEVTIEKVIQLFQLFMIVYVSSGGPEIAGLTLAYRAFCANPPPGFGPTRPRSPPALVPWGRCLCVAP